MKKIKLFLLMLLVLLPMAAVADLVEEEPDLSDNTGALIVNGQAVASESATSVDIIDQGVSANGTKEGEITLFKNDAGVEVFSGLAKVEVIPTGSDGWTGSLDVQSSEIRYTPAGRPQLTCPGQSLANWYGPCKISEAQE